MSKKCTNCGTVLDDDALFCSECGTKQGPLKKTCYNCGAVLPEGANFCMSCGTPITHSAPAPAAQPQSSMNTADCEVSQPDENTLTFNVKGVPFNMKLIKGGMMDNIELSDFYIGETVVTQALWQTVMGNNPSHDNSDLQFPVTGIDSKAVKPFMVRLKKMTGAAFDIPTSSQFEYAAVKGCENMTEDQFEETYWGDDENHPVCGMIPNGFGLYDLTDWCQMSRDDICEEDGKEYCLNPIHKEDGEYFVYLDGDKDLCSSDNDDAKNEDEIVMTLRLVINIPVAPEVEKAKYDAAAKRKEAEQRKQREEEERKKAEEQARRKEEKRKKAEEKAKSKAKREEALRKKREEEERLKAEELARKEEEERLRKEEEARREEEKRKRQEEKKKWEAEHPELVEERKRKEKEKRAKQAQRAKEAKAKEAAKQAAIEDAKKKIMEDASLYPVDLGLSVKWASLNLGASKPNDYGEYFAWGETETKDVYTWEEYELSDESDNPVARKFAEFHKAPEYAQELFKYCTDSIHGEVDGLTILEREDDAATVNMRSKFRFWGKSKWRMATIEEWKELKAECEWVWTNINGHNGYLVIAKNGNCIFLPAAGYKTGEKLYGVNGAIRYWSSSLDEDFNYKAHEIKECPDNPLVVINWYGYRYLGLSVRAVQD